jgi:hypothetical protein
MLSLEFYLFIKVNEEVKFSLCLTEHRAMKTYWGLGYSATHSLTSALEGGEWSASRPARFTLRNPPPRINYTGGRVGSRAGLDAVVKRKIPSPRQESNPRTPNVQPVASRYTD